MKRQKKALAIILVILMVAVLAGCGQASQPKNRLQEILDRGYMEVVMEPYFAPNQFIDPSKEGDDKYVGSDVEFAKYIAEKLGVECRIIPLEFSAVLAGVTEGKYDMAISALAYKPDRAEAMNLSKGYFFSKENKGHGLLIRAEDKDNIKSPDDLADRVVVVQSGSLQELFVSEQIKSYKELKRVSSTTDGFLMVSEGKADTSITAINTAELYIAANPEANLMVVEGFQFYQDEETLGTRVGMKKGEDELTEKINEIIDEVLASGIYEQWYNEYNEYAKSLGIN